MPGKSRHRRGKYSPPKKKRKEQSRRQTVTTPQSEVIQVPEPASSPVVTAQTKRAPEPLAKTTAVQHPYITKELRTIGIIAGILLIIIVVLALVLS